VVYLISSDERWRPDLTRRSLMAVESKISRVSQTHSQSALLGQSDLSTCRWYGYGCISGYGCICIFMSWSDLELILLTRLSISFVTRGMRSSPTETLRTTTVRIRDRSTHSRPNPSSAPARAVHTIPSLLHDLPPYTLAVAVPCRGGVTRCDCSRCCCCHCYCCCYCCTSFVVEVARRTGVGEVATGAEAWVHPLDTSIHEGNPRSNRRQNWHSSSNCYMPAEEAHATRRDTPPKLQR